MQRLDIKTAIANALEERTEALTITLSPWELQKLRWHATCNAATYEGHYYGGMRLNEEEMAEMARWRILSDKLNGREPS